MRITGRQLRQIIKEEVEKMMNEAAVPRSVEDGISEIVVAGLTGAAFEGAPVSGNGVKVDYIVSKYKPDFWSATPVQKTSRGQYITMAGRNYRGVGGGIQLEIFAPGGMIGPSEDGTTIGRLLNDVVNENLAELRGALDAAGGQQIKGSLTVQVPSAKFNFSDITAILGPAGAVSVDARAPTPVAVRPPVRK